MLKDDTDIAVQPREDLFLETMHIDDGVQALSQYVANEQSCLMDDDMQTFNHQDSASETESELEDDEAQTLGLLKKVELPMQTFREYLKWQLKNKVKVEKIQTGFVEVPQNVELPEEIIVQKESLKSGFIDCMPSQAKKQ